MPSEPGAARRCTAVLLVALALGLAACDRGAAPTGDEVAGAPRATAAEPAPSESEGRLVRTVTPEAGVLRATRSASAEVRALRDASVAAGTSARVVEILARPGDLVEGGDVVVRLDATQADLQLQNARLAVRQAEIDLERARASSSEAADQARASLAATEAEVRTLRDRIDEVRALVAAGGAARNDLVALENQLTGAEARLVQARDAVARAGRSEGEDLALLRLRLEQARVQAAQAEDQRAQTEVRAPFAGRVAELYVETGEFAAAGQAAFRLLSADDLEAVFDVPPEDAARLLEAGAVTLRYAGREVAAELVASSRPQQQARLVRLTARLADGADVPAGAIGEVRYEVALAEGRLLPAGALSAEGGSTWVYLARDGIATRVPVDVLAEAGAQAAVAGVDADDRVIYPRPLDVREGTAVRTEP